MTKPTVNPSHFYTRKDVGVPVGLLFDMALFSLLVCAVLGLTVFAVLILIVNHVISPSLTLISKILLALPTKTL